jgi:flagellar basal body-associated protein FliL
VLTAIVVLAVLLVLAAAVAVIGTRRRSAKLKEGFGPEYDRTVEEHGKRRQAEKDLQARQEEHEQLELRPLTAAARRRFTTEWTSVQSRFVDTPELALTEADALVTQLLNERGYPVDDFDTKSRVLSVEHADVLDGYRSANEDARNVRAADTETVRNAFLDLRAVFERVMGDADPYPADDGTRSDQVRR